ncbi:hypothetical protein QQF64_026338 [Cirrhinus molitorella]|uniref:Uncharacterized protein n=1 Tax=Cirrhinus molitorella TaxID=172907 RepID=A0ABR3N9A8_9TELE
MARRGLLRLKRIVGNTLRIRSRTAAAAAAASAIRLHYYPASPRVRGSRQMPTRLIREPFIPAEVLKKPEYPPKWHSRSWRYMKHSHMKPSKRLSNQPAERCVSLMSCSSAPLTDSSPITSSDHRHRHTMRS